VVTLDDEGEREVSDVAPPAALTSWEPQLRQNRDPGRFGVPHAGQPVCNGDPHALQKRASASFSVPQAGQTTAIPHLTVRRA
jgi:hypothetical protein